MSEHQQTASLQVILTATVDDFEALHVAGFQSVRIVTKPEHVYKFVPNSDKANPGWIIDPTLAACNRCVLALPAGLEELRDDLAVRLGDERCQWVDWPEETACAADVLKRDGTDGLCNLIIGARPMWTDEVCTIDDVPDPGKETTYTTGFPLLDQKGIRFVRPAFMAVIGPYGSGKSILLRQLAVHFWRAHGWRVLITAFEERIKPRILRDLRRHVINAPMYSWREEEIALADREIRDGFRFLRRKRNKLLDMDRLLDRIAFAVKVYGVDVVIIDPVNEIDHQVPKGESKTDYMGRFIMALKQLADDFNLLMIVAAHPPKDGVEKRLAKGTLLTLNDGADTAHWGNKADIGWCVWRPGFEGPSRLHIDKLKDYETMGKPTLAELELVREQNGFRVSRVGYDILASGDES